MDEESKVVYVQAPQYQTNHILHLLLSIVTAGLWIPVWVIIAAANQQRRNPTSFQGSTKSFVIRGSVALGVVIFLIVVGSIISLITR